jgi:hypothetical protein
VKIAYKLVYDSGPQLSLACRDWRAKPEAYKTWLNFQVFFKEAHRDISPDATAHNQGFAGYSTFITEDEGAEADTHLANMANAQATSAAQVTALTEMLRQMQQKLDSILAGNVPKAASAPNQRPPGEKRATFLALCNKEKRYCHTHGISIRGDHNSSNCTKKGPNHVDSATYDNRQGGKDATK